MKRKLLILSVGTLIFIGSCLLWVGCQPVTQLLTTILTDRTVLLTGDGQLNMQSSFHPLQGDSWWAETDGFSLDLHAQKTSTGLIGYLSMLSDGEPVLSTQFALTDRQSLLQADSGVIALPFVVPYSTASTDLGVKDIPAIAQIAYSLNSMVEKDPSEAISTPWQQDIYCTKYTLTADKQDMGVLFSQLGVLCRRYEDVSSQVNNLCKSIADVLPLNQQQLYRILTGNASSDSKLLDGVTSAIHFYVYHNHIVAIIIDMNVTSQKSLPGYFSIQTSYYPNRSGKPLDASTYLLYTGEPEETKNPLNTTSLIHLFGARRLIEAAITIEDLLGSEGVLSLSGSNTQLASLFRACHAVKPEDLALLSDEQWDELALLLCSEKNLLSAQTFNKLKGLATQYNSKQLLLLMKLFLNLQDAEHQPLLAFWASTLTRPETTRSLTSLSIQPDILPTRMHIISDLYLYPQQMSSVIGSLKLVSDTLTCGKNSSTCACLAVGDIPVSSWQSSRDAEHTSLKFTDDDTTLTLPKSNAANPLPFVANYSAYTNFFTQLDPVRILPLVPYLLEMLPEINQYLTSVDDPPLESAFTLHLTCTQYQQLLIQLATNCGDDPLAWKCIRSIYTGLKTAMINSGSAKDFGLTEEYLKNHYVDDQISRLLESSRTGQWQECAATALIDRVEYSVNITVCWDDEGNRDISGSIYLDMTSLMNEQPCKGTLILSSKVSPSNDKISEAEPASASIDLSDMNIYNVFRVALILMEQISKFLEFMD